MQATVCQKMNVRVTLFRKLQGGFTGLLQNRLIETESSHAMSRHFLPSLKVIGIALVVMMPAMSAFAGPQQSQRPRDRGAQEQDRRDDEAESRRNSLSDAVRRVERDTRGEVLSAERVQYDGRDMHRVKVVDDNGRVRVFLQDPRRSNQEPRADRRRPAPTRDDDD